MQSFMKAVFANRGNIAYFFILLSPFVLIVFSLMIGRYPISVEHVLRALGSVLLPELADTIPSEELTLVLRIRLPRVLAGVLIGASLAGTGVTFQGIFKNPLVDANLLGVTSGAGFGASIALLIGGDNTTLQVFAFGFGLLAVMIAYMGSRLYHSAPMLVLTLMGVLIGSFFGSLTALVKYLADPLDTLPAITFWLLGGINHVLWKDIPLLATITLSGMAFLWLVRWRLNILSLGDAEALTLGMNPVRFKLILIICATFMTACAVAVGGVIGWIGLVIPHAGRILVSPDHKRLIPASFALGGSFLMMIDNLSRTVLSTEVPLGILTGLIGVPLLMVILRRRQIGW